MRNSATDHMRMVRRKAVAALTWPFAVSAYWLLAVGPKWPTRTVGGVEVIDQTGAADESSVAVLQEAFELVRETAPWHFSRLGKHLRSIVIVNDGRTWFVPLLRVLTIRQGFLQEKYRERLAARLVPAAVEARLSSYGWWQRPELRQRLNRTSFEAAVHFARGLPDGLELIEQLSAEWDSTGWSVGSVGAGSEHEMRRTGAPRWLVSSAAWWNRLLDT